MLAMICLVSALAAISPSRDGEISNTRPISEKVIPRQPTFQGKVLFVEDPGSTIFGPAIKPDPNWDLMLTEIYGAGNYDWFGPTTDPNENGPDFATMSQYPLVIWNCYDYWWGSPQGYPSCLTTTDQTEIGNYIGSGGAFWLIGQDAVYSGIPQSWLNTYFYMASVVEDYAWNATTLTEQGENEIGGITCTFTCDYDTNNFFPDNLIPASGAHTILADQTYPNNYPAILYPGTDYKTTFWAVDGRGPDNWDNWKMMVQGIIGVLGVGEQSPRQVLPIDLNVYPNPANRQVSISYQVSKKGQTFLAIYDLAGRNVRTIINSVEESGPHAISFRTKDLASGVYFLRLKTNNSVTTKQLIVLR